MALDFSQYGGPSEEWLAVEKTLPEISLDPDADPVPLREIVNKEREARAAEFFPLFAAHVETVDYSIPTRDGSAIEARSYRPKSQDKAKRLPVYLYFHGGGFVFGTLSGDDPLCAKTAMNTGVIVLNVNYRHTPEHKFPVAWHDSQDAFAWLHKNINLIGGDATKILIGGVSAGGQLSASLGLEHHLAKSEVLKGLPPLAGQILIIPCVASPKTYAEGPGKLLKVSSYVENEHAPILPVKVIDYFVKLIDAGIPDHRDTKLNMINATPDEVRGLPPTVFGIAGMDPLRDEGLLYAKLLAEANVPTDVRLFKGVPHGHRRFGDALKASKDWDDTVEQGILWALSKPTATGKFEVNVLSH